MKTFELLVTKEDTDSKGIVTVPSMLSQIVETMEHTREDGMVARKSVLEIFERPRVDEIYNLSLVRTRNTSNGTEENLMVTDQDGHEIGSCTTEWSPLCNHDGMKKPDIADYIRKFFRLLPDEVRNTSLSVRLELNLQDEPARMEDISYRIKIPRSDTFLFSAGTGDNIVCSAALTTE